MHSVSKKAFLEKQPEIIFPLQQAPGDKAETFFFPSIFFFSRSALYGTIYFGLRRHLKRGRLANNESSWRLSSSESVA